MRPRNLVRTAVSAQILCGLVLATALFFSPSPNAEAAAPTGSSGVLQNSSVSTVDLVVTGTSFSTFVSSGTTTANATDRAKITWRSNNPSGAVINNATTMTLTFSTTAVGTNVSGNLTIAAGAVQDGSANQNALITVSSITDSAAPVISGGKSYIDLDHNGTVDYLILGFSESISSCNIESGDWGIVTAGTIVLTAPTGCSGYVGNDYKFNVTGATGVTGGSTAPQLSYTNQGTLGSIADSSGNQLANTGTLTVSDLAIPIIKQFTYRDANANGKIDTIDFAFTETLHSLTNFNAAQFTFTNVGDFTGAAFGGSTTDLIGSNTTTSSITLGTEATAVDTAENSGNIAISSQGSFWLIDLSLNGNIILGSQWQATFVDGAAPVYVSSASMANNSNYLADYIEVTYSEPISDASVTAADYQTGTNNVTAGSLLESFASGTPAGPRFSDTANDQYIYIGVTSGTETLTAGVTDYTLHIAQVGSISDASGNTLASFSEKTSTDLLPPAITEITPVTTPTTDSTPNYTFYTSEPGTLSFPGSCTSATTAATAGNNTITFSALADGNYGDCQIRNTDAANTPSSTLIASLFTIDATAPILSNVLATTSGTNIVFSWSSHELASSQVEYGTTNALGTQTTETDTSPRVLTHSVTVSNLNGCQTYYYAVRSKDALGNTGVSTTGTFRSTNCSVALPQGIFSASDPAKFRINNGALRTTTPTLRIDFDFNPAITKGYVLSLDPTFKSDGIQTISKTVTFNLPEKAGAYTLYAQLYSLSGHTSGLLSQSITYTPAPNQSAAHKSQAQSTFRFTRNLKLGNTGEDVRQLQMFLNNQGFTVAKTGAGSAGKETKLFGRATQSALRKFQDAHAAAILKPTGLRSGTGVFGETTRTYIGLQFGL